MYQVQVVNRVTQGSSRKVFSSWEELSEWVKSMSGVFGLGGEKEQEDGFHHSLRLINNVTLTWASRDVQEEQVSSKLAFDTFTRCYVSVYTDTEKFWFDSETGRTVFLEPEEALTRLVFPSHVDVCTYAS